jgi:oligopeptide transport system permease protein
VIEYNCRFGDPETQVVLPLLKTDLLTVMQAVEKETLGQLKVEWHDGAAACVILASGGYPGSYAKGKVMTLDRVMEEGLTPNYLYRYVYDYVYDEAGNPVYDADGKHVQELRLDENGKPVQELAYYTPMGTGNTYKIRVLYYNYYHYLNGHEVSHIFGTDAQGYDILIRLAVGCRLSLIISVCVSMICLFIGSLYGAIEGYYGGAVDMVMERITDILSGVPFIVVTSLFKMHMVDTGKVGAVGGLLFAFVVTGWIGTSYMVRMQFYRFKRQEYILAARTLGASDWRLMFRHIFPNALGTMITSSVLVIPGVIFSETSLAYLGIINFNSGNITSLGTMLSNGQAAGIKDYPHVLFFPAIILSLLMISFNLFGNGLRDAFNPNMRGVED